MNITGIKFIVEPGKGANEWNESKLEDTENLKTKNVAESTDESGKKAREWNEIKLKILKVLMLKI